MPEGILKFNLPEESQEFKDIQEGPLFKDALFKYREKLIHMINEVDVNNIYDTPEDLLKDCMHFLNEELESHRIIDSL
jgi:hypothetical protein